MQALIEPIEKGFRASTTSPFAISTEGDTEEEALARLRSQVAHRLNGGRLVEFDVPGEDTVPLSEENPLLKFAGDLKDEPLFDEWVAAMQAYRAEVEADPNY